MKFESDDETKMASITRKEERYLEERGALTFPFVGTLSSVVEKLKRENEEGESSKDPFVWTEDTDSLTINTDLSYDSWKIKDFDTSSTSSSGNITYVNNPSNIQITSTLKVGNDNDNS